MVVTKEEQTGRMRILVGDDQIGVDKSLQQKGFLRNYNNLADFDFENNPDRFIERAKEHRYDALLIDLNWEDADETRPYKTGFRVLEAVADCAHKRILYTSDDESRKDGFRYKATDCAEKHKSEEYMRNILEDRK